MKLANKLTLFLVLGMCIVLALDLVTSVWRELRLHDADMQHDEHVTGQSLGAAVAGLWVAEGRDQALRLLDRTNQLSGEPFVRWIDLDVPSDVRDRSGVPPATLAEVARGLEVHRVDPNQGQGRFFTYVPIRIEHRIVGAVELSESLAANREYVRLTLLRRIATTLVLIALSTLIAMIVGGMFVGRPMKLLIGKTRRIAAGDLSRPLELRQRDEIGELAGEIDAMCENLARAGQRIEKETQARITAIEQLRHADRLATVGTLASGVAHELGTPLNVAGQRAKMITSGEVTGLDVAESARIIAEQTQRMTLVIRQLLDFARRQVAHKAPHDLNAIAHQTAAFLGPLARRRGVTIRVEARGSNTVADVDPGQIQQALANLVMNGIQAMGAGGELRIVIDRRLAEGAPDSPVPRGDHWCLVVEDQGPGIAPEHLPHLFEPFFTTKQVGEGTGLGLAVAYGIVRDHGGWIEAESSPAGSRFTIHLPVAAPIETEDQPVEAQA